jgi:hypothetical protein
MDGDNLKFQALEHIRSKHGGVLRPVDVVKAARAQTSPLHKYFTWDDGEAAHQFRLAQARQLIRACVTVIPHAAEPIKAFCSLVEDRGKGDSYFATVDVLSDEDKRSRLLRQALSEANAWRRRYQALAELQRVFDAINEAVEMTEPVHT